MKTLFKNVQIVGGCLSGEREIFLADGVLSAPFSSPDRIYDLSGAYVFPGFCDVHVHFREPGFSYKETIRSGSMSAAAGGYTDVCTMPNLSPVPDSAENLSVQTEIIKRDAVIRVHPYGAITLGEKGDTLSDMSSMSDAVAFSDDGRGVQSEAMMRAAMESAAKIKKIIAAHCEVNSLLHGGYIHDGRYAAQHGHRGISSESEWRQIKRDVRLAAETGCAYHVCHISTKESVDIIRRAKKDGVDVTCETAPHYLVLCEDDLMENGRFKMNPPLRSAADREALIEGLCDGTIDMIATDHAPHSAQEKSLGLEKSLFGTVGLESAFAVLYTNLVRKNIISLEKLVSLMHDAPCRRFSLGVRQEYGAAADFTVFDTAEKYALDPGKFLSMGRATPFEGCELYGKCLLTVAAGSAAYNPGKFEL